MERFQLLGERAAFSELQEELETALRCGRTDRRFLELAGERAFLKYGALDFRHGLRHGLRERLACIPPPRLAEFANLTWLREQGFHAPRPIAAGCWRSWGIPRFQFLATAAVPETRTLGELLREGPSPILERAILTLARDVARLHALGFRHRDLYPRNVLVSESDGRVRVHFLDAWRGGTRRGTRGAGYDLACLRDEAQSPFPPELFARFHDAYARARRAGR